MREDLPDDVLLDIFRLLPDCEAIIRSSAVCKRWRNLIAAHGLVHRFGSLSPRLYTHLLGFWGTTSTSKEFKQFHTSNAALLSDTCLDGLPWPAHDVKILACVDDLLLVSRKFESNHLYVCNLFTGQCVTLPRAPMSITASMWGLVCAKQPGCSCNVRYKVVLFEFPFQSSGPVIANPCLGCAIFCSETGRWTESTVLVQQGGEYPFQCRVLTVNNAMHWLSKSYVVAYSPFVTEPGQRCWAIQLPIILMDDEVPGRKRVLGHLNGRLRLLEFPDVESESRHIRVWEHNHLYGGDRKTKLREGSVYSLMSWSLVHDVTLNAGGEEHVSVLGLDPEDGDSVFVLRGCLEVCVYNLVEGVFGEVIGRIGDEFAEFVNFKKKDCNRVMSMDGCGFFTLAHPPQPCLLPLLPGTLDYDIYKLD